MLIATILSTLSAIVTTVFIRQQGETDQITFGAPALGLIVFSLSAALLMMIALVFSIIGVIQTSKDEPVFKGVIFVMLLSFAVEVVSAIFTENPIVTKLSSVITDVCGTITIVLIVIGIGKFAEKLGDDVVFGKGQTLLKIIVWIALLSVIMRAVAAFTPYTAAMVIEIVMLAVTGILEIIKYILYLSFLGKSGKMLAQQEKTS